LSGDPRSVISGWGDPVRFGRKSANEYLPTWQIGRDQPPPNDFARYASEGYQNSIIYACIREKATSFADLPPLVMRPSPDGFDPVPDHPLAQLMAMPNEEMDAYEFLLTLATQYDVAGNVYIEKVRQSKNRDRRLWPVKELRLIRPDYIEIRPGASHADDAFAVKVDGQVRRVLPRRDVIHIRTANPGNDFYGLSPIAVAAREADLDRLMTDFDLSFFRNAGVPMGIMKMKSRTSPDEIKEIKGAFRRSFNGLKKWFEVLVLNADEAEYQQLGGLPKDMEMPGTREYAEARVCAIFGVPPIIVGVLVGLTRATYSNYAQAQASFWSETMAPFAKAIGSALTRELLPEFATSADRGAQVSFSLAGVRALQEDNTARLTGVADLVRTGGWTINEALGAHGLASVANGDFYVRQLTQVIDVALPSRSAQQVAEVVGNPIPRTIDRPIAASLSEQREKADTRAARDRLQERFQRTLETFFEGQAARVVARLPKGAKATPSDLLPASENGDLADAIRPSWTAGAQNGWEIGAAELGVDPAFDPLDPGVRRLLAQSGERVSGINAETRDQLRRALGIARDEGLSPKQVAQMIRDLPAFNASRAETVARTELATADNAGAVARYRASGLVDEVAIIDGPECGWTAHDDGDLANGTRRSLDDFENHTLSHPNCVRSRSPVIRGS